MVTIQLTGRGEENLTNPLKILAETLLKQGFNVKIVPEQQPIRYGKPKNVKLLLSRKPFFTPQKEIDYLLLTHHTLINQQLLNQVRDKGLILINTETDLSKLSKNHKIICINIKNLITSQHEIIGLITAFIGCVRFIQLNHFLNTARKNLKNETLTQIQKIYEIVRKEVYLK